MRKFILGFMVCCFLLSYCTQVPAATMYSDDGRCIEVADYEISAYEAAGWYWGKPTEITSFLEYISFNSKGYRWYDPITDEEKLYIIATVGENRVPEYEAVGWYWGRPEGIFNLEGKMVLVGEKRVPAYEAVGWYWGKPTTVYNMYGETLIIGENRVDEYNSYGWCTTPYRTLYSLDGRTSVVRDSEVYDYESVGWFWGPPIVAYSLNGESRYIGTDRLYDQAENNWYWYPYKPVKLYDANGNTVVVDENTVTSWINVGWFTENPKDKEPAANYGPEYKDCIYCDGGYDDCVRCSGRGKVKKRTYIWGVGWTNVSEDCSCSNGRVRCTMCSGRGMVRK